MDPYAVDLVKDGSGMTMGISNFVYEDVNDDHSHQYADLGEAVPKKPELPSAATHPRRKPNKLYEPSGLKKKKRHESDIVGERNRCGCLRESRLIKLCLFVIVFLFLLCLFLIILLITGQLRVQTTGQQGKPSHQKSFSSEPLQKTVAELQTNITNMEALLLKFTRSNLETSIVKVMADMRALNETFRRSSQQQSFSLEPLKKTISELQANITKMEALLNEKKSDDNIQVPIVNGSVSVLDLQRHFDAKLNSTKDQLQAATGRIAEQMTAMNSSLVSKIQAVSLVQGVQGLPGFNGSDGSDGDSGRMGLQGLPGINGTRGPPGSGNFSQCQYKASTLHSHKQDKATSVSTNLVQPDGFIIIDASCSTIGTQEYNLEINVPVGGGNPNFICHCKGISTLFPSSDVNVYCTLHYLLCPKTT
ncbi:hypothetical protein QZH41_008959 [Actinostola sp. cb2023]|nr:hypothetical protein QZH41_008959 [Actinostola sp. cb2023]